MKTKRYWLRGLIAGIIMFILSVTIIISIDRSIGGNGIALGFIIPYFEQGELFEIQNCFGIIQYFTVYSSLWHVLLAKKVKVGSVINFRCQKPLTKLINFCFYFFLLFQLLFLGFENSF